MEEAWWYYSAPVGQNKFSKIASEMCKLAEIPGETERHTTGVPEKSIEERIDNCCVECLHKYEHPVITAICSLKHSLFNNRGQVSL